MIIKGLCGIDAGKDQHITYIHEEQYFKYFSTTGASAIIIGDNQDFPTSEKTVIKVNNAANAFSKLITLFHSNEEFSPFISTTAIISDQSTIGENVYIGNHVVIDDNVIIGREAGYDMTSGGSNTSVGNYSLQNTTTGGANIAIGMEALQANTTADGNTAVGYKAMEANTTGNQYKQRAVKKALKSVLESIHNIYNFMVISPFDVLLIWWFILQALMSKNNLRTLCYYCS